ncbi:MAG: HIT domain-containing protein [Candidatus Dadabacteria bacterium]|nr:HIT domain-containing protein [Candidatus Dadabacteria bacterium]NIQ15541.1 HIT domain-containing protein [Candidatus Dadabacteria bacterium]
MMKYSDLVDFIENRMRMAHIYQPVMLMSLLENNGICNQEEIAKSLLSHDISQIEYYTSITNNMVGKVLRSHNIVDKDKQTKDYKLLDFDTFSKNQINSLITLCKQKLEQFLENRGDSIFQHRRKSTGYISGTIKYEVLKRARFRCELCGISAEEKALEVDHIIPRNKGGTDDINNFQALCYSCNAMKRDRDDTDFREIAESYKKRKKYCLFCEIPNKRIIEDNDLAYAIRDGYPVTEHHTLIIPKRHVSDYFDLGQAEVNSIYQLLSTAKVNIQEMDKSVTGYNIGINVGESAGQSVFHCHIHLIPRRNGDISNPKGGVRHVIPGKGNY